MHFSGVLISISVPDVMTLPSFCTFSVASGHKPASLFPYFPYCTNSIEMVVPRGQVNWRYSLSQPARWYVRNVPDSSAGRKGLKEQNFIDLSFSSECKNFHFWLWSGPLRKPLSTTFHAVFIYVRPSSKGEKWVREAGMKVKYNVKIYFSHPKSYLKHTQSSSGPL